MKASSLLFIIAIFNFVALETVSTQSPITFHTQLSVDNYLKDREVRKIDRDESGIFWLMETSVIQKYDGRYVTENIVHSIINPKYFTCLSNNKILIISQESEAFFLDKEKKSIDQIPLNNPDCEDCKLKDINLINEEMILYYEKDGLLAAYKSSSEDLYATYELLDTIELSRPKFFKNIFKVGSDYLIFTNDEKLYRYSDSSELELTLPSNFREHNAHVSSEYINPDDFYFSMPRRNGTYRFHNKNLETIKENAKLVFAKKDKKGRVLLALSRSYLHSEDIYIKDEDSLTRWQALADINETFIDGYVEDIHDKILLGSHTGLFYVKMQTQGITPYHQSGSLNNGFGNVILSFAELPNGDAWYVKENKGIFKYNAPEPPDWLPLSDNLENNLNCYYDAVDSNIWVSGYTDSRTGILTSYNPQTKEVDRHDFDLPVMYFKRLNKEELILSSSVNSKSTLLRYNPTEHEITDTLLLLEDERSRRFEFHNESGLLIATSKRLILYHLQDRTIQTIIPETIIQSIVKISQGYAACTLGKGIIFLNNDLEIVKIVDENNGLTNNQIYSVIEDKLGRIWAGTGNGLNILDKDYKYMRSFRETDGLSSYELNTNAVINLKNDHLLFGTINGVTEINPDLAMTASESAVLSIPSVVYEKDGERISQNLTGGEINLSSGVNHITFDIHQNNFYKSSNIDNPISPRIQSFPENLKYDLVDNKIIIPSLEYSNVKLNIYPANPLKSRDKIEISMIKKREYQSLIMFLLIVALIGLLSYFITRKIISINKKRDNTRRKNEVRMAELELQALRSQMNPHFIFNSLGAILLYLQTNEKKKAEKYLTKFAKLMRMFLESSKSKFISFDEEQQLLALYLELEELRFEDKFKYEFDIDPRVDKTNLTLPSMLLQPFVENSINHGLYHKKGTDGKLIIQAIPDGDTIKVIIFDNGVGREKAKEIRANSLKKHRSRATEIIQERIQVLKKEKNIDIDIEYIDLMDDDGNSLGTKVIITLPKILKTYD
ncbi:sensor histidine kinase [Portibacter lacus]|uniref:Signal transduction histidine kinase internal region domain-containing protein n=1 Tax=Portibacter lacus TaxID=1099794 RepID=A0AA37SJ78_9BACT|nr:histidine kinase [Portibacter lacus]GLR15436.1 hypothetical protein GCM10007940_00510 [Portibacter lacus]